MTKQHRVGVRLAIRHEGDMVNAYLAMEGTMEDAFLMASIRQELVRSDEVWQRWKSLLSDIVAQAVQVAQGVKPDMVEREAPPHEKAGRA